MIFLCEEFIEECFDDVMKPFGEIWRRDAVLDEAFQYTVLRPWFQFAFALRHTAALAVMDAKPANTGRRANGHLTLWDLGNSIVYPKPEDNERRASALWVLGRLSAIVHWVKNQQVMQPDCRRAARSRRQRQPCGL